MRIAGVVLVVLALGGCFAAPPESSSPSRAPARQAPAPAPKPSPVPSPGTVARINALKDCGELQREFDAFDAVRAAASAGSERAVLALEYMRLVDNRMQVVGCY